MQVKLVVVRGKASKSQVSLKLPSVIGRSREADLTVAHPMVSRRHCEIFESNGALRVRDLGSLNGTFVRKQQVQEAELLPNDELTIGPLTFRVEYQRPGLAEPPDSSGDIAAVAGGASATGEGPQGSGSTAGEPPTLEPVGVSSLEVEPADFGAWDAATAPAEEPELPEDETDFELAESNEEDRAEAGGGANGTGNGAESADDEDLEAFLKHFERND